MIIDDALNMAYSYAATICQDSELCKVSQEFNGLAGETERRRFLIFSLIPK